MYAHNISHSNVMQWANSLRTAMLFSKLCEVLWSPAVPEVIEDSKMPKGLSIRTYAPRLRPSLSQKKVYENMDSQELLFP